MAGFKFQTGAAQQRQPSTQSRSDTHTYGGASGLDDDRDAEIKRSLQAQAAARSARRTLPPEFELKPGETTQVILLDTASSIYFNKMHNIENPSVTKTGRNGSFHPKEMVTCLNGSNASGPCPCCGSNIATFCMHLSVQQPTSEDERKRYAEKNPGKSLPDSMRRWMTVKATGDDDQHEIWKAMFRTIRKMHPNGCIRGAVVDIVRGGTQSPKSGQPNFTGDILTEEQIIEYFGHDAIMSTKNPGEELVPANGRTRALDYPSFLGVPHPDSDEAKIYANDIAQRFNLSAPRPRAVAEKSAYGSQGKSDEAYQTTYARAEADDEIPFGEPEAKVEASQAEPKTVNGVDTGKLSFGKNRQAEAQAGETAVIDEEDPNAGVDPDAIPF